MSTLYAVRKVAGLPNITGGVFGDAGFGAPDGCFHVGYNPYRGTTSGNLSNKLNFDASLSSPIYGSSDTVTPLSESVKFLISY